MDASEQFLLGLVGRDVVSFQIDPKAGSLQEVARDTSDRQLYYVRAHPAAEFFFVVNQDEDLLTYRMDTETGIPHKLGMISIPGGIGSLAVHPAGNVVLLTNRSTQQVVSFLFDRVSGELTLSDAQPAGYFPGTVAVEGHSNLVFVGDRPAI
ncbi:MAG: hypothetical protein ACE5JX_08280 [Acidobacteriota bacterium]